MEKIIRPFQDLPYYWFHCYSCLLRSIFIMQCFPDEGSGPLLGAILLLAACIFYSRGS